MSHNGSTGIAATNGSVVRENTVGFNRGDGIAVTNGSLVSDNAAYSNSGSGIAAVTQTLSPAASSVQRNVTSRNGVDGLYLVPESGTLAAAYRENVISNNQLGSVVGGVNMGDNSCNGTPTCP